MINNPPALQNPCSTGSWQGPTQECWDCDEAASQDKEEGCSGLKTACGVHTSSTEKTLEENIEEDYKDLCRNLGTQVIEKDCGYECGSQCDENQEPVPENINKDTPSSISL
ncbi:hypothetical protein ACRRTK_015166 [Alexandromys fortis]